MFCVSEYLRILWFASEGRLCEQQMLAVLFFNRLMTKPTEWLCAQRRLRSACPVWSESLLCTQWVAKDPSFLHADSKDSDQSGQMPRLICLRWAHMPLCWFCHLSRRLTRWAYSIPMVLRLSSSSSVRRHPHFQTWISLKAVGQSWSNFIYSITGVGERLHKVLGQIGSKLWFLWQQKAPIYL